MERRTHLHPDHLPYLVPPHICSDRYGRETHVHSTTYPIWYILVSAQTIVEGRTHLHADHLPYLIPPYFCSDKWKEDRSSTLTTCPIWSLFNGAHKTVEGRSSPQPIHLPYLISLYLCSNIERKILSTPRPPAVTQVPTSRVFFFFFGVIFSRTAYINIITPPKVDPYLIHWDMFSMVIQSYGNFRGESEFSEQQVTKVISKCTLQGFIKGKTAHVLQGLCCRKSLQSKAKHRQMSLRGRRDIHLSSVVLWFGTFLCNLPIRQSKGESDWTIHGQPNVPITSSYYSQIKGI